VPRSVSERRYALSPFSNDGLVLAQYSAERVADREPNEAARRDSGEKHPIFQF
jgi:hypothetical protein